LRELALFAGAGGGILGGVLTGFKTVCAVEIDAYCRNVLFARQKDGMLPRFPIWDDARTFDGKPWRGKIDVITGGFPCQDISSAGKGAGITGERSGLVFEMLRIVAEVRPRFVFAENSPNLRTRGLVVILKKLAILGYDARWGVLGAWHVGAPHRRNRMWILAHPGGARLERRVPVRHEIETQEMRFLPTRPSESSREIVARWPVEPDVGRVAHGVADRVDRIKSLGNGQVPRVAQVAWEVLHGETEANTASTNTASTNTASTNTRAGCATEANKTGTTPLTDRG
jgi:DNA (cytosine-5)-methyltransferase 1